jgi:hypothetical protein
MSLRIACLAIALVAYPALQINRSVTADATDAAAAVTASDPPAIVVGFTGGFVRHDDMIHGPVQLGAKLRRDLPSGTFVGLFENRRGGQAHAEILRQLEAENEGALTPEAKQHARIVLFGHSWGATEALMMARELQADGLPVLLTVQVDSVLKPGQNDSVIPSNVEAAANFYQTTGFLHGQTAIRAADPTRTQIIGNYKLDYAAHPIACYGPYPWWDRLFLKAHTEIECDPSVWDRVEMLIRSKLP